MNKFERYIHNIVRDHPLPRKALVRLYQRLLYLTKSGGNLPSNIKVYRNKFFGFHDKSPWSYNDELLLSHSIPFKSPSTAVPSQNSLKIGYFSDNTFHATDTTNSWNWQQGASLQWLGKSQKFSFHHQENNKIITVLFDTKSRERSIIDDQCAAYSHDGETYVSYCFQRFHLADVAYGYKSPLSSFESINIPKQPVLLMRKITGKIIREIYLEELIRSPLKDHFHYISHALFSPNSSKLAFFFRTKQPNQAILTKLFVYDLFINSLTEHPVSDASHMSWHSDDELLCYCVSKGSGAHYHLIETEKPTLQPLISTALTADGHPYMARDKNWFVTDTYPDRYRIQKLYHHDLLSNKTHEIMSLKIPFLFSGKFRCDFHPRLNNRNNAISIDAPIKGIRSHVVVPLNNERNSS